MRKMTFKVPGACFSSPLDNSISTTELVGFFTVIRTIFSKGTHSQILHPARVMTLALDFNVARNAN